MNQEVLETCTSDIDKTRIYLIGLKNVVLGLMPFFHLFENSSDNQNFGFQFHCVLVHHCAIFTLAFMEFMLTNCVATVCHARKVFLEKQGTNWVSEIEKLFYSKHQFQRGKV